jgi:hypothetical protein
MSGSPPLVLGPTFAEVHLGPLILKPAHVADLGGVIITVRIENLILDTLSIALASMPCIAFEVRPTLSVPALLCGHSKPESGFTQKVFPAAKLGQMATGNA